MTKYKDASGDGRLVKIKWRRYLSYDEARSDTSKGIYIHEWQHHACYVGKLYKAKFGRRYSEGYRHWVDGCLDRGARLFIGAVVPEDPDTLEDIERTLIQMLDPQYNLRRKAPQHNFRIVNVGDVPEYLQ